VGLGPLLTAAITTTMPSPPRMPETVLILLFTKDPLDDTTVLIFSDDAAKAKLHSDANHLTKRNGWGGVCRCARDGRHQLPYYTFITDR
jgi:hypothetical protein